MALERERVRAALLDERTRIARELHDVVAHHMSVIAVQAEAAPLRVDDPPAPLRDAFAAIRGNAVAGLTELRRVVGLLRGHDQGAVQPQPQLSDLDALVANVRAAGLQVESSIKGTPRQLAPGVQVSAFRLVQEALSNVIRHAPDAAVDLTIAYTADALEIDVVNGASRSPVTTRRQGDGILGMRERVAMLGGRLQAAPTRDGGFAVLAVLPTDNRPHA